MNIIIKEKSKRFGVLFTKLYLKLKNKTNTLFKKGFFHILTGNTLTNVFAFISSIVVVRLISKADYAYLTYSNNLYSYIILLSGFGLSTALLKFCSSSSNAKYDKAYLKLSLFYGAAVQLLLSFLIVLYVYFVNIPFPQAKIIVIAMLFIPFMTYILQTLQNYARAHYENRLYAQAGIILSSFTLLFSILFALNFGIIGIVFAKYISLLIAIGYLTRFALKKTRAIRPARLGQKQKKAYMMVGFSFAVGTFFSAIMPINELFLVNLLIRDEIITSNYKVAILIPSQLGVITSAIMIYFFPVIAKMKYNKNIWNISKKILMFSISTVGVISIMGIIITPYIIKYIFGASYNDSISLMYIFWLVYFFNAGFRMIPLNIMPALGRVKFIMVISVLSCITHLALDWIFIKLYGIQGVAIATFIVYTGSGIAYWVYLKKICESHKCANIIPIAEEGNFDDF